MHPKSQEYRNWWREQRVRCLFGYTVGGRWIPGNLYWYGNFWHILLNKKGDSRKTKSLPDISDLEWEVFLKFDEAKNAPNPLRKIDYYYPQTKLITSLNHYRDPEMGTKGITIVGARDGGKSYMAAGIGGHEYTFYKDNQVLYTASEVKYSRKLLEKVKFGLDNIEGEVNFTENGKVVTRRSPFSHQRVANDWSDKVVSGFFRNDGTGKNYGYNSMIQHIVYGNNSMAANGTRPSVHFFEEVGAWTGAKLSQCFEHSIPCWTIGTGGLWGAVPFLLGTGGDMTTGTTDLRNIFYNPEEHNMISIDDKWEGKGKITYFIPRELAARKFKDKDGNTNYLEAEAYFNEMDAKAKRSKNSTKILTQRMYYPKVPSHVFLRSGGSIFPTAELQEHLSSIENDKILSNLGQKGMLVMVGGKSEWRPDDELPVCDYPMKADDNKEGCIVVYEPPVVGKIPYGMYIAGIDPYDIDDAATSDSLGSCLIYKRFTSFSTTYNIVVAEYTARPNAGSDAYYENVRRLLQYYNAKALYENNLRGFEIYMRQKGNLQYLFETPEILDTIINNSKVERKYGIRMSQQLKRECALYVRKWLLTEYTEGKYNYQNIYSIPLIKELIAYNEEDNFDRVIAFMLCVLQNENMYNILVEQEQEQYEDKELTFFNNIQWN